MHEGGFVCDYIVNETVQGYIQGSLYASVRQYDCVWKHRCVCMWE